MADARFLVGLIFSLVISSTCIALVTGEDAAVVKPSISFENSSWNTVQNLTKDVDYFDSFIGGFEKTAEGLRSSVPRILNAVRFSKSDEEGDIYHNRYVLDKNDINSYALIIRDTGYRSDTLRLYFEPDTLTLETAYIGLIIPRTYYDQKLVNTLGNGEDTVIVETNYDVNAGTLVVSVDNREIAKFENLMQKSWFSVWKPTYYGGVDVNYENFVITGYTSNSKTQLQGSGFDIFAFLNTLGGVLIWYTAVEIPSQDSPWFPLAILSETLINIVIKIQQIGIVAYGVQLLLGN